MNILTSTTSVLVTLNPGHQSAWNARKRLVESGGMEPHNELQFTAALLTVRECAKHSILWNHRRWLFRRIYSKTPPAPPISSWNGIDEDALSDLSLSAVQLQDEFQACTVAANTYERNYFAWLHRTRCLDALVATLPAKPELEPVLTNEFEAVKLWIERHVGDYTAMQYFCHLTLIQTPHLTSSGRRFPSAYQFAKSLVESYPDHESPWYFLRDAVLANRDGIENGLASLCRSLIAKAEADTAPGLSFATDASGRYAKQFLAWSARLPRRD